MPNALHFVTHKLILTLYKKHFHKLNLPLHFQIITQAVKRLNSLPGVPGFILRRNTTNTDGDLCGFPQYLSGPG